MSREERGALLGMAVILVTTVAWWALALMPVPGETPVWLARTRSVCFNTTPSGLPDASGWLRLIGEPIGMSIALFVVWKGSAVRALRRLMAVPWGRALAALVVLGLAGGAVAAFARVARAAGPAASAATVEATERGITRLDTPASPLGLVDQRGERVGLASLRGRPVLLTFAYGHCETVCPVVVHDVVVAAARAPALRPAVVVVTLDPWRDTPSRLPHLARQWGLGPDGYVLGGTPDRVNAVLDAWGVTRSRNTLTGDIAHPALVYVLGADGRIAFEAPGGVSLLQDLLARL